MARQKGERHYLMQFLRASNRGADLSDLTQTILEYALVVVPQAQSGTFLVLNDDEGVFEYRAAVGWDLQRLSQVKIPKECVIQRHIEQLQPFIVRDPQRLNREFLPPKIADELNRFHVAAFMTFPICVDGEMIAYLNVDSRDDPDAFSPVDLERLRPVWEEITLAVRAARVRWELAESEQLFRLLFERLPHAVYVTSLDGTVLAVSPAAVAQTGYAAEELVGMSIVHDLASTELGWTEAGTRLARGETVRIEAEMQRKAGRQYQAEITLLPFTYRERRSVFVIVRDLTAQIEAQEATRRRDAVLSAMAVAAERLLRAECLDEAMSVALAELGEAVGVSRAYIFQKRCNATGQSVISQRYEWVTPGVPPQIGNHELQDFPLCEAGFSRWDEAFTRGEPIAGLVREFPAEEQPVLVSQGILSLIAVPIFVGSTWWGFLGFDDCVSERRWSSVEIETLRAAAGIVGAAVERAKVENELQAAHAELQGLYEMAAALGTSLELGNVFERVYGEIAQLIPCDAFALALVDKSRATIRLAFAVEAGERLPELVVPFDPQKSLTAWIASTTEPLLVRDFEQEKDRLPAAARQVGKAVRSWIGVPLLFRDEVLGVLSVQSFAPHAYDEKDLRLLRTMSAPVATAIRNARSFEDLTALAQKLRQVEETSRRMQLVRNTDELYAIVLNLVDRVLGYRTCAILERRGDALVVVAEHGHLASERGVQLSLAGNGLTAACLSGKPLYVPDVAADTRYVHAVALTRCELVLPLTVGEGVFGVLDIQAPAIDAVPQDDQNLLGIVAAELAVALTGLKRLAQVEKLGDRLAGLHGAAMRLQRCSEVEELCAVTVTEAARILGFATCNVGLIEGDWLVPMASADLEVRPLRRGEGVAWHCLETGQVVCANLVDLPQARPTRPDLQSVLSVPIGDFGVFQAVSIERDAFGPEDVLVAETLAGHLNEGIRRIRVEKDLREQAIRDPLTGLYNRRFLGETLAREIERAKRYGHPLTLIMADVDDFKTVNDRYGHAVGDAALRCIAAALQTNVRAGDFVFRYGGEEFVIILPETGNGGDDALQRLQETTSAITLADAPGLMLSVSLGYVEWKPSRDGPTTLEDLLRQADAVLYAIKRRRGSR